MFDSQDQPELNEALAPYTEVEKQPKWVARVLGPVMGQVLSLSRVKDLKVVTPRKVGVFLGQKRADLYMLGEASQRGQSDHGQVKRAMELLKEVEARKDLPEWSSALHALKIGAMFIEGLRKVADAFEKSVHEAFRKALEQPNYNEAVEHEQSNPRAMHVVRERALPVSLLKVEG